MGKFNPERLLNDDNNKKDTLTFENMRRLTAKTGHDQKKFFDDLCKICYT
ncbi:14410_t:CDS:1, partial [Entrophospora sp. SA101]